MASGNNARQAELNQQQQAANAQFSAALTNAQQKSPLQQREEADALKWYDFIDGGKTGIKDYSNAPGLPFDGLAEQALANREEDLQGGGDGQLSYGANPTALALVREHNAAKRAERQSIGYNEALAAKDAMVRGTVTPQLIATDEARNATILGATTNRANATSQNYANFRPTPSPWLTLAAAGIGAASSYFTGGYAAGH